MNRVIVVGGGAAGAMAAIAAAKSGSRTTLFEKNEKIGKKLFITGKGRCNVTNACEPEELFANVVSNGKFLYSAFYSFDNNSTMDFFEQAGCRLKTERGDRVFPRSDHSSDVIAALNRELSASGAAVFLHTAVKEILLEEMPDGKRVRGVRLGDGREEPADSVVVATGGVSYESTGSTGDGYRFAERAGHKLAEAKPALVPFNIQESFCRDMMGLSLKNVSVSLSCDGRELYQGFGEMLFTHFGVSGPLILTASSYYAKRAYGKRAVLRLDLKPALTEEQLDKRILRDFEENRNRLFKNALGGLFPARMIPVMVALSGIDPEKKVNEVTREERKGLVSLIKGLPMTVTGCRNFPEAIITQGGVSVKEINPSTMESKIVKGLYFAGEVLDLDALTGGFNLQIAWSTGYLAGRSAAQEKQNRRH